jgi:hypothetical protein
MNAIDNALGVLASFAAMQLFWGAVILLVLAQFRLRKGHWPKRQGPCNGSA